MDSKATGIVAYFTWVGFLIAFCIGDREGAKFHLNQALVICLLSLIAPVLLFIPILAKIWGVLMLVCSIIGIITAANGEEKPIPIIGEIHLLK